MSLSENFDIRFFGEVHVVNNFFHLDPAEQSAGFSVLWHRGREGKIACNTSTIDLLSLLGEAYKETPCYKGESGKYASGLSHFRTRLLPDVCSDAFRLKPERAILC